jgi:hypothetical protein
VTHPRLNQLVELARRERPAPGAMEAVARSLRVPFVAAPLAAIVIPSTAMATLAVKVGLSRSGLLSWGAGSTVAASGVVLAMALTRPTSPPPPPAPTAPLPAHPASDQVSQKPAEPAVTAEVAETPSPPINPVKELPALWDEPQLIERARKALSSEPRRALSLTQEHQRRFPVGALAVERDVIALEALARSGQTAEAKRRARAFEAKYPKSIHLPRVRALLARLGSE